MWFLITILGYFILATVLVLDKLILTKSVGKPVVYTFYSTIFLLLAFLAWPLGVTWPNQMDIVWGVSSGLLFGVGLLTMFIGIKTGEASHLNPFNGGVITIATYALSSWLLGERLTQAQMIGVLILSFATFLLSFEKSKKHHGFHVGFLWAILSGVAFAVSQVASKHLYEEYNFLTGIVWSRGTAGIFGLLLFAFPSVRRAVFGKRKKEPKTYGKKHAIGIVVANKVLSVVGIVLVHYGIAIGSVTLVNALAGAEYVFMFLMIFALTRWLPRVFQEYFTREELALETTAIVLVTLGSILFVI